jgi:amidase
MQQPTSVFNPMLPKPPYSGPELCALSAYDAVQMLKRGEISPVELLDAAFARIENCEPKINALPTLCEERARAAASQIDKSVFDQPGSLAGLPITIKDLTPVAGVRTTYGTPALADFIASESSFLVERLEARGGVVIGKSNTPEMGAGGNTFNSVFGATRNPWDTRMNAGGSSGGAAVSVATGETWLAHGSDLAGSLRTPAAYCGVVGLRPSPGRAGGANKDHAFNIEGVDGPVARSVLDAALFLDAMTGFDPRMPLSLEAPGVPFQNAVLQAAAPARIAYTPDLNGFAPVEREIDTILRASLEKLESMGTRVELACPDLPGLYDTYRTLRGAYWATLPGRLSDEIQAGFKETLQENVAFGKALSLDELIDAQRNRSLLYGNMQRFLEIYDVLAFPVVGLEPGPVEIEFPPEVNGEPVSDYVDWLRFSFLSTATSLPSISVPAGLTASGMPVGIQLIGPPRGEAKLLGVASFIEKTAGISQLLPIDPIVNVGS